MTRHENGAESRVVVRDRIDRVLDHPLLAHATVGVYPRRSAIALGTLTAFGLTVLLGLALEEAIQRGSRAWWLGVGLDLVRDVSILAATALLVLSLGYALWNGGPGLAALLASGPSLVTALTRAQLAVTNDVVARLLVAGLAATIALLITAYRTSESVAGCTLDDEGLLLTSAVAVVATVCYLRLLWAPSTRTASLVEPAGVVLVPTIATLAICWWHRFRASTPDSVRPGDAT